MKEWNEEELEKFIKENKNALVDGCRPIVGHEVKFMTKLQLKVKHFVDLTPYFVKVAIVTIIIFLCSIFTWYSVMRPDPSKSVIENIIEQFKPSK